MGMTPDTYSIYTRTFAKVASGAKIQESDFGVLRLRRFLKPFDQRGQVAVALAVQDVAQGDPKLKSKGEFEAEVRRLFGSSP